MKNEYILAPKPRKLGTSIGILVYSWLQNVTLYSTKLNIHQNADIVHFFFKMSCPAGLPHSPNLLRSNYYVFGKQMDTDRLSRVWS